jgi:hypothetical protein
MPASRPICDTCGVVLLDPSRVVVTVERRGDDQVEGRARLVLCDDCGHQLSIHLSKGRAAHPAAMDTRERGTTVTTERRTREIRRPGRPGNGNGQPAAHGAGTTRTTAMNGSAISNVTCIIGHSAFLPPARPRV